MAFSDSIFAPLSAFSAAVIAGAIAYVSLITTKESKVSEFRQKWISDLRDEISKYTASADVLMDKISKDTDGKHISLSIRMSNKLVHGDLYADMIRTRTSILLRINDKEKVESEYITNKQFLDLINDISKNFENGQFQEVHNNIDSLVTVSRALLKHEWNRARDGEKRFQQARACAEWVMGGAGMVIMAILVATAYEAFEATASAASINNIQCQHSTAGCSAPLKP